MKQTTGNITDGLKDPNFKDHRKQNHTFTWTKESGYHICYPKKDWMLIVWKDKDKKQWLFEVVHSDGHDYRVIMGTDMLFDKINRPNKDFLRKVYDNNMLILEKCTAEAVYTMFSSDKYKNSVLDMDRKQKMQALQWTIIGYLTALCFMGIAKNSLVRKTPKAVCAE